MESLRTLSLFAGAGGLDLGARIAGAEVELSTDLDLIGLETIAKASRGRTLAGPIDELLGTPLMQAWGQSRGPDLIIGGPPCTPFSHAGFWLDSKREGLDPARTLLSAYAGALRQFRPTAFLLENVPGLAFATHRVFLDNFVSTAEGLGYHTTTAKLSADQFGVAQRRRRLFVVGTLKAKVRLDDLPRWPPRTAGWALTGVRETSEADEAVGGKYGALLPAVPAGGNYLHFTAERGAERPLFKYRGRYWSFLLKLDPEAPSPTLPATRITYNGPFHWDNRRLRVPEMARLQSFPDGYPFAVEPTTARRHIGNAVPPLMAAAVTWRIKQALGFERGDQWPSALEVAAEPTASFTDITAMFPTRGLSDQRKASAG